MDDMQEPQQPQYTQDTQYAPPPLAPTTPGLAIASLILGIAAIALFLCCNLVGIISGILAVIFGHISMSRIKKQPDIYTGRGLAAAGLITGYIGISLNIIITIVGIIFLVVSQNSSY